MPAVFGALSGAFSTNAAFGLCAGLMCAALLLMTALRARA
jgi:hypothetical protein